MELILLLPILIFSVIFHEVSHGFVALKQGDDTALTYGRLTLNPLPHLDPVGSILFPAICIFAHFPVFGWAKPVPINPDRFRHYRSGVFLVSLAGPMANFLVAVFSVLLLFLSVNYFPILQQFPFLPRILTSAVLLNLVLAIFNLIPIPPLDGSRLVSVLLPAELSERFDRIEPYGIFIVMALMMTGILSRILYPAVDWAYRFLLGSFGLIL